LRFQILADVSCIQLSFTQLSSLLSLTLLSSITQFQLPANLINIASFTFSEINNNCNISYNVIIPSIKKFHFTIPRELYELAVEKLSEAVENGKWDEYWSSYGRSLFIPNDVQNISCLAIGFSSEASVSSTQKDNNDKDSSSSSDNSIFKLQYVLIGIAIAGFLIILVLLFCIKRIFCSNSSSSSLRASATTTSHITLEFADARYVQVNTSIVSPQSLPHALPVNCHEVSVNSDRALVSL
jgi:hypothetical protein